MLDIVISWRAALPREPLPAVLQQEIGRCWMQAATVAQGWASHVNTIPREWLGRVQAGDRAEDIARALYDTLGHDGAARLASELVREIEHRGESARRGRQLLDCWLGVNDAPAAIR